MKTSFIMLIVMLAFSSKAFCQDIKVTRIEPTVLKIDVHQWQSKTRCDTNPQIPLNLVVLGIDAMGMPQSQTLDYYPGKPIVLPMQYKNMLIKVYPKDKTSGLKPQQFDISNSQKRINLSMEQLYMEE